MKSKLNSPKHELKHEDKINNFINKKIASPTQPVKVSVNTNKTNQSSINSKDHTSNYLMFNKCSNNMTNNMTNITKSSIRQNDTTLKENSKILSSRKNVISANPVSKISNNYNNCTKLTKNNILKFSKSGSKDKVGPGHQKLVEHQYKLNEQKSNDHKSGEHINSETSNSKLDVTSGAGRNSNSNEIQLNNYIKSNKNQNTNNQQTKSTDSKDKMDKFLSNNSSKQNIVGSINVIGTSMKVDLFLKPKVNNYLVDKKIVTPIKETKDRKESKKNININNDKSEHHSKKEDNKDNITNNLQHQAHPHSQPQPNLQQENKQSPIKENSIVINTSKYFPAHKMSSPVKEHPTTNKYVPLKTKAVSLNTKKNQTYSEIKIFKSTDVKEIKNLKYDIGDQSSHPSSSNIIFK